MFNGANARFRKHENGLLDGPDASSSRRSALMEALSSAELLVTVCQTNSSPFTMSKLTRSSTTRRLSSPPAFFRRVGDGLSKGLCRGSLTGPIDL